MISNDDVSIRKLLFQTIKNFLFPKGSTSPCSTQPLQFSSPNHVEGIYCSFALITIIALMGINEQSAWVPASLVELEL
ncbi:hypothetical protein SAMN05216315_11847 [Nitrosospira sp. Nsp18]|nr:hypothetical protein SAMN05216315_11847 [Nitrosospira sp. Nsp18]